MTWGDRPPGGHVWPWEFAGILEALRQSPGGTLLHDQLDRIVQDWDGAARLLGRSYSTLLLLVLDLYEHTDNAHDREQLLASLVRARRGEHNGRPRPAAVSEAVSPSGTEAYRAAIRDLMVQISEQRSKREREGREPDRAPPPEARERQDDAGESGYPAAERRVNSVYRLHLDRKHDEIEKLQNALLQKANEAIAQNKEFGALLEIERNALQQANSTDEINELKQILIGGTEELMKGQTKLGEKLQASIDYLRLVKSDSEGLRDELNKVRLLSLTDEATGLPNRRAFIRRLDDEISRSHRYGIPLALAIIDLDEFKSINDCYGHAAGDAVLVWYAHNVLSIFRHHDMVARYGGEEFAVLLTSTNEEGALHALSKVRKRIADSAVAFDDQKIPLPTFSTGLTLYAPGESPDSLLERADRALYRAKQMGRDRIEVELVATPAPDKANDGEKV